MKHNLIRQNDQLCCPKCGRAWDLTDDIEDNCVVITVKRRYNPDRALAEKTIRELKASLKSVN